MEKIITVRYPHYYKKISCTGSRCEDTCCASWGVSIDPVALRRYRNVNGEFGRRLKNSIDSKTLWSRQLEHSDYNLEKMERIMREHRAWGTKKLMLCIG